MGIFTQMHHGILYEHRKSVYVYHSFITSYVYCKCDVSYGDVYCHMPIEFIVSKIGLSPISHHTPLQGWDRQDVPWGPGSGHPRRHGPVVPPLHLLLLLCRGRLQFSLWQPAVSHVVRLVDTPLTWGRPAVCPPPRHRPLHLSGKWAVHTPKCKSSMNCLYSALSCGYWPTVYLMCRCMLCMSSSYCMFIAPLILMSSLYFFLNFFCIILTKYLLSCVAGCLCMFDTSCLRLYPTMIFTQYLYRNE